MRIRITDPLKTGNVGTVVNLVNSKGGEVLRIEGGNAVFSISPATGLLLHDVWDIARIFDLTIGRIKE